MSKTIGCVNGILYKKGLNPDRVDCPIPGCNIVGLRKKMKYGWKTLGRHLYFSHGIKKENRKKWIEIAPHSHVNCHWVAEAEDFYESMLYTRYILRRGGMDMKIDRNKIFHNEKQCTISDAPRCMCRFGENTMCNYLVQK